MDMCRACLITEQDMVPLDEDFVKSYNLLTHLNVTLQDAMPQHICATCAQLVRSFVEFREKSILSEATLRDVIQVKNIDEDDLETGNEYCIKQEIKVENDLMLFDGDDDYFDNTAIEYQMEEVPIKLKKEPVAKKKLKKSTKQNKKNKSKGKTKHAGEPEQLTTKITVEQNKFQCGICIKRFGDENILKNHLQTHTKYTECEICHERFSAWPALLGHRLEHIPEKKGQCHLCNKRFLSPSYLEHHYITMHNDGQQLSLKCKMCDRSYKTPKKLKSHINMTHAEPRYFCDHCSKGFRVKSILRSHLKTHSDVKSVVCDLCGFRCHAKHNLVAHKLRRHTPNTVTCKACTSTFRTQEGLDKHKCRVKEIACHDCGKMVLSKMMTRHMASHGEARHKCLRCPAAFRSRDALRVHCDRHDGVRRLQCEYCPAKFYSATVLIKHRRTHTGEKPYVCTICGKGFTGGNNLKVHMKVHGIFAVAKKNDLTENISDIFKY